MKYYLKAFFIVLVVVATVLFIEFLIYKYPFIMGGIVIISAICFSTYFLALTLKFKDSA
jgi:hypothetical protein